MLSWLLSILMLLFGIAMPTGPIDPPPPSGGKTLDCSKPLTGTLSTGWGLTDPHAIAGYSIHLDGDQVTMMIRSNEGDEARLSKVAPQELVTKLCEAINNVSEQEWRREQVIYDIGPLFVEVSDGSARIRGEAYTVEENPGIRAVSRAARALTDDLYAKLKVEAEAWQD